MIHLEEPNNFGCMLRDGIYKNIHHFTANGKSGTIINSKIRAAIDKIEIPEQYWPDVLIMANFRINDRCTDFIEQCLERVVHRQILSNIIKEERESTYGLMIHENTL